MRFPRPWGARKLLQTLKVCKNKKVSLRKRRYMHVYIYIHTYIVMTDS